MRKNYFKNLNFLASFIFIISLVILCPFTLHSNSYRESPHGDETKVLRGCRSCHKGHGSLNTPMLPEGKETFCYRCHGNSIRVEATRQDGDLASGTKAANIERIFEKTYRHPVEQSGIHRHNETLPETDASTPRHVECVDCHHYHYVTEENKIAGIKGVNTKGEPIDFVAEEYELCFKCHSYSANLPPDQTNKALLFDISNPSYHPVIAPGKNNDVPSLISPLTTGSLLKCSTCHNNDDVVGPRGPHASSNKHILVKNFSDIDGPENEFQYELCYGCHRRNSILANETFTYHNLHIVTVQTSCRTCHNPHGSTMYSHLIELDAFSISPSSSGRFGFVDLGSRSGECYLTCHGKDHNPAIYPTGY